MSGSGEAGGDPRSTGNTERIRLELYERLVHFQHRVNTVLDGLRDEASALFPDLEADEKSRWEGAGSLPQLHLALDEVEEMVRRTQARLRAEVNLLKGEAVEDEDPLPAGLARFVAERSIVPGFEYTVEIDSLKGRVLRWRIRTPEGWIRAAGLLPENPHSWLDE
ncbi:MAG: hypothetical protein EA422_10380 [Gemmatimonadales bacterium]|nr:MAG: hypothetical protein EA422_10380 [Gemmatimonadales bacterium]